jgi:hypothetical protein
MMSGEIAFQQCYRGRHTNVVGLDLGKTTIVGAQFGQGVGHRGVRCEQQGVE